MAKTPKKEAYDILIIEDEIEIANIVKKYLKLYPGFKRFVIAKSSFEATQKLSNQEFDLIVTDIQLERGTVLDFIERIKSQPRYFNVKIMIVSGCVTRDIALKLMRFNIRHILVKPFTARQLLIHAIGCLGIDKKPGKMVDNIISKVTERLSQNRERLEDAIPDTQLQSMIKTSKGEKD